MSGLPSYSSGSGQVLRYEAVRSQYDLRIQSTIRKHQYRWLATSLSFSFFSSPPPLNRFLPSFTPLPCSALLPSHPSPHSTPLHSTRPSPPIVSSPLLSDPLSGSTNFSRSRCCSASRVARREETKRKQRRALQHACLGAHCSRLLGHRAQARRGEGRAAQKGQGREEEKAPGVTVEQHRHCALHQLAARQAGGLAGRGQGAGQADAPGTATAAATSSTTTTVEERCSAPLVQTLTRRRQVSRRQWSLPPSAALCR